MQLLFFPTEAITVAEEAVAQAVVAQVEVARTAPCPIPRRCRA